ncbi:hypothetical protein DMH12_05430 [Streptomyces sp. WAC 04229]|nr:hypothetical protein DMH12_05430 [Streptomyces sp. WAC 04229]
MSEGWCVRLQGGGGRRGGALATDDNAADGRAGPRVCGTIRRTGPRFRAPRSPAGRRPRSGRCARRRG